MKIWVSAQKLPNSYEGLPGDITILKWSSGFCDEPPGDNKEPPGDMHSNHIVVYVFGAFLMCWMFFNYVSLIICF